MTKNEIKAILSEAGIRQWEVAEILGMSEFSLSRKLRHPVSAKFEAEIRRAIEKLKEMKS